MNPAIQITGLDVSFPGRDSALRGDFVVEKGQLAVVGGASGSGKTTLLDVISGLCPHIKEADLNGQIRVRGRDPRQDKRSYSRPHIGYLLQIPEAQLFNLWVHEEVPSREHLSLTGGDHLWNRRIDQLSVGEKQKVALASLLCRQPPPEILLLDEPLAPLDQKGRSDFLSIINRLTSAGITVVVTEHRLDLFDRAASKHFIQDGRLQPVKTWPWIRPERRSRRRGSRVLTFNDVTFGYSRDRSILKGANLTLSEGEWLSVVGPNGSGKSTLAGLAVGVLKPGDGNVERPRGDGRGLLTDIYSQILSPSPRAEIRMASQLSNSVVNEREAGRSFNLERALDTPAHRLSVGQAVRTVLAAHAISSPPFLVLDEPTAGQDRASMTSLVKELEDTGAGVLLATHELDLAWDLSDRILFLEGGRLVEPVYY